MIDFVSIDIETTGLDRDNHQILEIGAVSFRWDPNDLRKGIRDAYFHGYIKWETIIGDPIALCNNTKAGIMQACLDHGQSPLIVMREFHEWLLKQGKKSERSGEIKVIAAGKNFEAFDLQFLKKGWEHVGMPRAADVFRHRVLNPAGYYCRTDDVMPPSLDDCCKRAGVQRKLHTALEDAEAVCDLLEIAVQVGLWVFVDSNLTLEPKEGR